VRAFFAVAVCLSLGGCGVAASQAPAATSVPAAVLPATAVQLPAVTSRLSAEDVSKVSTIAGFAAQLRRWGYMGGWERTFQGESRMLTYVVSRSLTFGRDAGATAFVAYMHDHVAGFFPFSLTEPLVIGRSSGWIFEPPECACHMANPYLIGVAATGRQVLWLEINGPVATTAELRMLLAKVPMMGGGAQ